MIFFLFLYDWIILNLIYVLSCLFSGAQSTGTFIAASRYGSATPVPPSVLSRGVGWLVPQKFTSICLWESLYLYSFVYNLVISGYRDSSWWVFWHRKWLHCISVHIFNSIKIKCLNFFFKKMLMYFLILKFIQNLWSSP